MILENSVRQSQTKTKIVQQTSNKLIFVKLPNEESIFIQTPPPPPKRRFCLRLRQTVPQRTFQSTNLATASTQKVEINWREHISFPSALSKHRDKQTLIPLTVKKINKALLSNDDKENFLIDGVDVNNVKLVGMVLNKAERVTDVSFVLDDGTGGIDCNRWVHEAVDTKEMEAILEGMYVQVNGQLKVFQGRKQLAVFGILCRRRARASLLLDKRKY
ncbi:putative replication factor A protein [Helianthus debilis subsp. tardiflorus]